MTHEPRSDKKPVEEVAKAMAAEDSAAVGTPLFELHWQEFRAAYEASAEIAINTLRDLGFITADGLAAIHAEEDANGQPRSVLPRYAPPTEPETR